mgnify:CR=1 FL=1
MTPGPHTPAAAARARRHQARKAELEEATAAGLDPAMPMDEQLAYIANVRELGAMMKAEHRDPSLRTPEQDERAAAALEQYLLEQALHLAAEHLEPARKALREVNYRRAINRHRARHQHRAAILPHRSARATGRTRCRARVRTASRTGTGGDADSGGDPDPEPHRVERPRLGMPLRTTPHHISHHRCLATAGPNPLGEQRD